MGDVIEFPRPKEPRKQAKELMKIAKQEKDPVRRAKLFNEATEILKALKNTE